MKLKKYSYVSAGLIGVFNVKGAQGTINLSIPEGSYHDVLNDTKVNVNAQLTLPKVAYILEYKGNIRLKRLVCELLDYKGY